MLCPPEVVKPFFAESLNDLALLRAKEKYTVSQYAEKYRVLQNEGGGHVGAWSNEKAPYLTEIMDCLGSPHYLTTAVSGPGQCGKTSAGENWLVKAVGTDPGDFLWYMQSEDSLESYVKTRINPMIEAHEHMQSSIGKRAIDNSLNFKKFRTMDVEFLSATKRNLINKSAPRIIADEIDAYPPNVGNVKPLLDIRRQSFGYESMLFLLSHPDKARGLSERDWNDGIMSVYADSDRRVWYWPCPHCGGWSSPCPISDRYMYVQYPEDGTLDEIQDKAVLVCPINGCLISDAERLKILPLGKWVGAGQIIENDGSVHGERVKRDTAGFFIVGVMSPFILGGIGALSRARVKAEREFEQSGEDKTLKEVMTKQWGFPYVRPKAIGSVTANELADRSEMNLRLKMVPPGVRFLTAALDVQKSHFDCMVRGWGERGESWIVDVFRINGQPASLAEDWDKIVDRLIRAAYPLEGLSSHVMPIRGIGYDSAGEAGVTRQAYDAWLRWKRLNYVRRYGQVNGKEAWSVLPLKGANSSNAPRLTVTYPDTSGRKDRQISKGTVPVCMFNPNLFKDDLNGQLQRAIGGPWATHFPRELRSKEEPHEWFEQLVSETRDPSGKWEKISSHSRNEALDLMCMTHALAHVHGLSQINWARPPSWAMPWDSNSFLVPVEKVASETKKDNNAIQDSSEPGVKVLAESEKKGSLAGKIAG